MENKFDLSALRPTELVLFYNISRTILEAERYGIEIEQIVAACENELYERRLETP